MSCGKCLNAGLSNPPQYCIFSEGHGGPCSYTSSTFVSPQPIRFREYPYLGVKFKKLDPEAIIPTRKTADSAGFDLHSLEDRFIPPGQTMRIRTGIACAIPPGFVGLVKPRSSVFFKGGDLDGTIDADYRGELQLQIHNTTNWNFVVQKGERYAQLVVVAYVAESMEVDELDPTDRGTGGFGSTGK